MRWAEEIIVILVSIILVLLLGIAMALVIPKMRSVGPLRLGEGAIPAYSREAFGPAWKDTDGNGCDQRNDVLGRDLDNVNYSAGSTCVVQSGELLDPYTGLREQFLRGTTTSRLVQIDHGYSLQDAWYDGAYAWTPEKRLAFATDPDNLVATTDNVNGSKAASDPTQWRPPLVEAHCRWVARYLAVAAEYDLQPPLAEIRQQCPLTRR